MAKQVATSTGNIGIAAAQIAGSSAVKGTTPMLFKHDTSAALHDAVYPCPPIAQRPMIGTERCSTMRESGNRAGRAEERVGCDFCERQLPLTQRQRTDLAIAVCDECAAAVAASADGDPNGRADRETIIEVARSGLDEHFRAFVADGSNFTAAPDATEDERRCATVAVMKSLVGIEVRRDDVHEEVQDDTRERAKTLFAAIDRISGGVSSQEVIEAALARGAANASDFAQALENAGLSAEAARSAGKATEAHFTLAALDAAEGERHQLVDDLYVLLDRIDEVRARALSPRDPLLGRRAEDAVRAAVAAAEGNNLREHVRQALAEIGGLTLEQIESSADAIHDNLVAHTCGSTQRAPDNTDMPMTKDDREPIESGAQWLLRHSDWILIAIVAAALLIAPWRFTRKAGATRFQQNAPYSLIFSPPKVPERFHIAEIDTTRYAAQVLAAMVIAALVYARTRAATAAHSQS